MKKRKATAKSRTTRKHERKKGELNAATVERTESCGLLLLQKRTKASAQSAEIAAALSQRLVSCVRTLQGQCQSLQRRVDELEHWKRLTSQEMSKLRKQHDSARHLLKQLHGDRGGLLGPDGEEPRASMRIVRSLLNQGLAHTRVWRRN